MNNHETPEEKRERLRQEELKKNPIGTLKDGFNGNGNLADLVGSLGWKGTGILIVVFFKKNLLNLLQLPGAYFIIRS
ncbi:hypothetical protein BKC07_26005 [Peribacillus simplex]|nr:hypothetical protein BKC07_26005 [Peribacillus simplex]